jgi:Cu-Zn family superoxide dismutase
MRVRMTRVRLTILLAAGLTVAAAGLSTVTASAQRDPVPRGASVAQLVTVGGARVGTVTFVPRTSGAVTVTASARGLTPGYHGFHVHNVGRCDGATLGPDGRPTPFATAGPHYNPDGVAHGQHRGDLPPLLVSRGGVARVTFVADRFRARDLLDADGSAVIVHATFDNQANVPDRYVGPDGAGPDAVTRETGDTGARVLCGVVRPVRR